MLKSMTGYGRGEYSEAGTGYTVEIRSVNHRFCDITVKQPKDLMKFEDRLKELIKQRAARGKIDVFVTPAAGNCPAVEIKTDIALIKAYLDALREVNTSCGTRFEPDSAALLSIPGAFTAQAAETDEAQVWKILSAAAEAALDGFTAMREREGNALKTVLQTIGENISCALEKVEERAPQVPAEYRDRLNERLEELGAKEVDPQRLAAEVAFFADKCSIDEEIARLKSHLDQLGHLLNSDAPAGKQLDFLVQEMNREVNTIGSKANDISLTSSVLLMKNEIEKLREQIQNIE